MERKSFASVASKTASLQAAAATSTASAGSGQSTSKNGANPQSNQASTQGQSSPAPTSVTGTDKAVASPSPGTIDWIIGTNVKVVTQTDEVFEGQVYAYDVIMNCICVSKPASSASASANYYSPSLGNSNAPRSKFDFRILKINHIKDVTPLPTENNKNNAISAANNASSPYATALPAVGFVQLDKLQQREQQAVRETQVAAARIGVGVTDVAQEIFDALSKTLPCRWAKEQIVVMDEVVISPPYEPENCKANPSASYLLARIKKV
ncbi:hypothetical protein BGZ76_001291 [Entomortierella beljakovae]|nr:hypothetical protein BGZ76_001291 [Entomortierella beljakovae]